jgi:hypothetical protein
MRSFENPSINVLRSNSNTERPHTHIQKQAMCRTSNPFKLDDTNQTQTIAVELRKNEQQLAVSL